MDIGTVSSDDVIASYRNQLADAHHQIAVLQAQLSKAVSLYQKQSQQAARGSQPEIPDPPMEGTS